MLTFLLLLGSVLCEVAGQVAFKLGVPAFEAAGGTGISRFARGLANSPWVVTGVLTYAVEFVLWFAALSRAPLSIAFAFAALAYCGVVLASRLFLHEHVDWRQWRATGTIAVGVTLVCLPQTH
ncbi:MAG: EamA family transporter [Proteobacteria bacterium]|nr:EamA family transporter [Pseudomonadota bacterium]MBS0462615.1 EamA family transporter [Pseudomonadota bacterium]